MRDIWYGDKRDLIKWAVLVRLASIYRRERILQIAYYRPSEYAKVLIDGEKYEIPPQVITHFRNVHAIEGMNTDTKVSVLHRRFADRKQYLSAVIAFLSSFEGERCIVFLDPDTGLQPRAPSLDHVLDSEACVIWNQLRTGDVFVLYQHETNKAGKEWIEPKRAQLARAIGAPLSSVKVAQAPAIARDVVLFYLEKEHPRSPFDGPVS